MLTSLLQTPTDPPTLTFLSPPSFYARFPILKSCTCSFWYSHCPCVTSNNLITNPSARLLIDNLLSSPFKNQVCIATTSTEIIPSMKRRHPMLSIGFGNGSGRSIGGRCALQDLGGRRGSPALCNVGSGNILGSLESCFLKALGVEVPVVVAKVSFTLSWMHLA